MGLQSQENLGIAGRLERLKGREQREQVISARFTAAEEKELATRAARDGKLIAEWMRDTLLREARKGDQETAVFTELIALRQLMSTVLRPVALGETVTAEAFAQIIAEIRTTKRETAKTVLEQYRKED